MVGTSGALRVLYEGEPDPRPGLFCYLLDERRVLDGGAVSDGGNLYAWLERTLAGRVAGAARARRARPHVPLAPRRRAQPRLESARDGRDRRPDLRRGRNAICSRRRSRVRRTGWPRSPTRCPRPSEVVATGHALLENPWWAQLCADVFGRPVTASGWPRARREAPPCTFSNGWVPSRTPRCSAAPTSRIAPAQRCTEKRVSGSASSINACSPGRYVP